MATQNDPDYYIGYVEGMLVVLGVLARSITPKQAKQELEKLKEKYGHTKDMQDM